jgi:hypothetical protein
VFGALPPAVLNYVFAERYRQEPDKVASIVMIGNVADVGFIRRLSEAGTKGACLIREHEQRSVDFMRPYLAAGPLAEFAPLAELIHTTNFARCACETLAGLGPQLVELGRMLGTSDLISQIAGRFYLERCHHFLFQEFVDAGADRALSPTGETVILYATSEDLLRKTPGFYEHLVKPRLENEFQHAYGYIGDHFGGDDPYQRALTGGVSSDIWKVVLFPTAPSSASSARWPS